MTHALGVGIAIQALETLVSVTAGSLGALYLAWPSRARAPLGAARRHRRRVATAVAAVLGVVVLDLF